MLSHREKKIRESIDLMFQGLDDEVLKTVILYTALGKSEEEKDAICEEIKRKQQEDMEFYNRKFNFNRSLPSYVRGPLFNRKKKR